VRGTFANRVLPVVAVGVVLAAAAAVTTLRHPLTLTAGTSAAPPSTATVNGVIRACPQPGLVGTPGARVALIAASTATGGSAGPGQSTIARLGPTGGTSLVTLKQPGALTFAKVKTPPVPKHAAKPSPAPSGQTVPTVAADGGVVIQATGSMARGLEAEQVTDAGSASTRCDSPGTDWWFAGPGRFNVRTIQLYLLNPGSQPADINVEAFTDAGPVPGGADTGVAVAPHSMIVQSLDTMLKGSRVIALHIRTSTGQVTAALHENTGKAVGGVWLPPAQEPADQVVLPGLPATPGTRQLFVTVPGTQDAHITLTAVTSRGSYQPTGGGGLDIPGGSAVQVSLPSLAGFPGAIKVSADVPVTATAMIPGGQSGAPGVFTAADPAIQEQGVVAQNLTGRGKLAELVLTAPLKAVSVRIVETAVGASQPSAADSGKIVKVEAKHTRVVQLARAPGSPKGTAFALMITPLSGSGPLYAARVLAGSRAGGTVQSILPVPSAPSIVPLPTVRNAPITPGH
jgi:hypothetical protein